MTWTCQVAMINVDRFIKSPLVFTGHSFFQCVLPFIIEHLRSFFKLRNQSPAHIRQAMPENGNCENNYTSEASVTTVLGNPNKCKIGVRFVFIYSKRPKSATMAKQKDILVTKQGSQQNLAIVVIQCNLFYLFLLSRWLKMDGAHI